VLTDGWIRRRNAGVVGGASDQWLYGFQNVEIISYFFLGARFEITNCALEFI
jgi:hypothetical protein